MVVYDSIKFQGMNRVFLAGTVNEGPTVHQQESGRIIWRTTLAVPEQFKDKNGNIVTFHTHHIITAVDELARYLVSRHIDIGTVICVDGRLNHCAWIDPVTKRRHILTDVYAHLVQVMAEPPKGAEVYDPPVAPQYRPSLQHEQIMSIEPPDEEQVSRFENVIPINRNRQDPDPTDDSGDLDDDIPF